MFRDTNREAGSEAYDISHLVEGMKDEHVSEAPDRNEDKGVDQAPEGLNDLVLSFREKLQSADLSNQEDVDSLNGIIAEVAQIDESQGETLKEEFMNKKIE